MLNDAGAGYEAAIARATLADLHGDAESAQTHLQQAADAAPDLPFPLVQLANLAARRGDANGQLSLLEQAEALAPNDPGILLLMTGPLEALNRYDDLVALLDRCTQQIPELAQNKQFQKLRKKYAKKAR